MSDENEKPPRIRATSGEWLESSRRIGRSLMERAAARLSGEAAEEVRRKLAAMEARWKESDEAQAARQKRAEEARSSKKAAEDATD